MLNTLKKRALRLFAFLSVGLFLLPFAVIHASATINNISATSFSDIQDAVQGASAGDTVNISIQNDIVFTGPVTIGQGITLSLTDGTGGGVTLSVASGGAFRLFQTTMAGGTPVDVPGIIMTVGAGVTLDGGGTGSGILLSSSGGSLNLNGCTIQNCIVPGSAASGAGLWLSGSTASCALTIGGGAVIQSCVANGMGGGIYCLNTNVVLNDGTVTGNSSGQGAGGGIYLTRNSTALTSSFTMNTGATVSDNFIFPTSWGQGGGVFAANTAVTINDGTISGNASTGHGGGIYIIATTAAFTPLTSLSIHGGTIENNQSTGTTGNQTYGGGVAVDSINGPIGAFTMNGGTITGNTAEANQGQGGGIYFIGVPFNFSAGTISDNHASQGGGVFYQLTTMNMTGDTAISDNTALNQGGGIYAFSSCTLNLDGNAKITGNTAQCNNDPEVTTQGGGGVALLSYGDMLFGTPTVMNMKGNAEISGNTATSYGGGIWTYPIYGPAPVVNIESGAVTDNIANYGGGISLGAMTGYTPLLNMTGGSVDHNTAVTNGGGIIGFGSAINLSDCAVTGNAATNGHGGGIYLPQDSTLTVGGVTTITNNTALNGDGGGIYTEDATYLGGSYANLTIGAQTVFTGNVASAAYAPQADAATAYPQIQFASTSILAHPLNNYDINYRNGENPPLLVKVIYDPNGGIGSATGTLVAPLHPDTVLSADDAGISHDTYAFLGWNTMPDGSGAAYGPDDIIILPDHDVTVYAQWKKIGVTENSAPPVTGSGLDLFLWAGAAGIMLLFTFVYARLIKRKERIPGQH